ncbi:hypothetical protein [Bradyrhizobium ottawaense]|uniref:hypothetical protein n=1 Tax=Bradyrhizobium ottawaense TaxID=931866 RepID=UPI0015CF7E06|nr:hypothetical protein [Bradyrhizobium ottawaense]
MSEKIPVEPFDQLRFTREEGGGWAVVLAPKSGGLTGAFADRGDTFDEAVAKIKQKYDV